MTANNTMVKTYLFADLDDSLFSAEYKLDPTQSLLPAAHLKDGTLFSFMDETHQAFLKHMHPFEIIPVTARNLDSFSRVRLPFSGFKIISFGAVILDENNLPVKDWHSIIAQKAKASEAQLVEFFNRLRAEALHLNVKVRLIEELGLTLYVLIKSLDHQRLDALDILSNKIAQSMDLTAFKLQRNGNNLTIVPKWLNKSHAVVYLQAHLKMHHPKILSIGMGDSYSDLAFMHACDYALYPTRSQIKQGIESNSLVTDPSDFVFRTNLK